MTEVSSGSKSGASALERLLRHDRAILAAGITAVAVLAWVYTVAGAGLPAGAMMARHMAWSPAHAALMFAMWWVMMIAMMLPSAAPTVLLFAAVARKCRDAPRPYATSAIFLAGYLAAWAAFSLAATLAQWGLESAALLAPGMTAEAGLGGAILLAAGLYQFTPVKHACLAHCRNPAMFLSRHWRPGTAGALRAGAVHGAYCLGCCWFLMALLFFGGVMNPYWIAGIAAYVALEKLVPRGRRLAQAAGALLAAGGALVFMQVLT